MVGINEDGALLVSTSTSVKHSASLGDNTGERRDSNVSAQQQEVAAKQQKEEEEALEELLVGVHDQVYGKKHLIDNNVLNKREGKGLPIFIHIPKAGGTSVEAMVANVGARIGSCNSRETNGASNEDARRSAPGMGRRKSRGLSFAAESGKRKDVFRKFIHDGEESIFKSKRASISGTF